MKFYRGLFDKCGPLGSGPQHGRQADGDIVPRRSASTIFRPAARFVLPLALALGILNGGPIYADTIVGGLSFNDSSFVDKLVSSTGSWTLGGQGTLQDQVVGSDVNDYAFCFGGPSVCTLDLAFTDNVLVNGPGADLAVFELGIPDSFDLTINGVTGTYWTADTGFTAGGYNLNVAKVDLSDFGIPALSGISQFQVASIDEGTTISYTAFGAINSASAVPEPASFALIGGGLIGLSVVGRRRRRQKGGNSFFTQS